MPPPPPAPAPIGIFDSGVGGLHVTAAIRRRLPAEPLVYLGDTARLPYGSKSAETVRAYAHRCAAFLLAQGAKMVVIACNTASAHATVSLARALPVPVVGVIEAGAAAALAASRGGPVGVLATYGTLASGAYRAALGARRRGQAVVDVPCPLWVPLAEEDMGGHPAARLVIEDDLRGAAAAGCDALLLGCTHYPLLRPQIATAARTLWPAAGHPPAAVVEGALAVADAVARQLPAGAAGPAAGGAGAGRGACALFTTGPSPRLWALGERLLGEPLPPLRRADL